MAPRNLELEAAAFADLDDVDRWRVFADWLSDVGDPRGELANLALARRGAFLSAQRAMRARIAELERPHLDAWHLWAQDHDLDEAKVTLVRGFVHRLEGPLFQLGRVLDELFDRHPIGHLTLTDVDPDVFADLLARAPAWPARLRYLKLQGEVGTTGAAALAAVALPELRGLNLLGAEIDDDACAWLARLRTESLERLTLTANEFGNDGLRDLLRSDTRGQWRELYLSSNGLDGAAVAMLAADKALALIGLYMRGVEASLPDFQVFADRSAIPTLTRLELDGWGHRSVVEALRERFGAGLRLG